MTPQSSNLVHALSFDIEDWFHIVEVKAVENPDLWPDLHAKSSLVERYTDLILEICARHNTRATFFILGWVAERHPAMVARIAAAGHEIGTHSYWHRKVYELTPQTFREDMQRSIDVIEAASGTRIAGFRAPSFSITAGTEWAFDVIADLGLLYDASLFPAKRGHGGYACPQGPHHHAAPSGRRIPELPMSIAPVGYGPLKKRMCFSGGGYMRLLPLSLIEQGIAAEAAESRPTVIYLHPRDFAPDCPKVSMPPHRYFKCYVGTSTTARKLDALLERHRFDTCRTVLENHFGTLAPLIEEHAA
ncbi:MAG: polysaccharide deacetylase family protein [Phycisphaeraceae bacterium]|nr:polysaccharide deacetylase family protein [Phycisphaeraceae bacterium]MCW5762144.1 polysaccharide deacetylase family protein [Phycisphaeraceae bacterium]